jgi:hypothetical protein
MAAMATTAAELRKLCSQLRSFTRRRVMKKILLLALLFLAPSLAAQSTTVSATVQDPDAVVYGNGTVTVAFVPAQNFPSSTYVWSGGALSQTITGTTNSGGTFSVSIPSNGSISPAGSQWSFTVCSYNGMSCATAIVTVVGSTQSITTQLNANAPLVIASGLFVPKSLGATGVTLTAWGSPNNSSNIIQVYDYLGNTLFSVSAAGAVTCVSGCGGGGGTPGGSNTQYQYNNAGAFGGVPDLTFNGTHTTTLGASGILTLAAGATLNGLTVPMLPTAIPNANLANVATTVNGQTCTLGSTCTITSGLVSGLTTGFFPKAASATSLGNTLCDEGITTANQITCTDTAGIAAVSYNTTGSNGGVLGTEGTGAGLTAAAGVDLLWPDSTAHRWKFNPNNAGGLDMVGIAAAGTANDCVKLAANGIDIVDNGSACGSGGSGTVTVVSSGSLTSTALVTGGGTTTLQTPSATATLSSGGNMSLPGTLGVTGHVTLEGVTSTGATGTGNLVFGTSPTFVTPVLGTPSSGNGSNLTALNASNVSSGNLAIAREPTGKTVITTSQYTNATTGFTNLGLLGSTGLTLAASTNYVGRCVGIYQGSVSTASPNIQFTGPASPTLVNIVFFAQTSTAAASTNNATTSTGSAFSSAIGPAAITTSAANLGFWIEFLVQNGTTAGTLALQMKSAGTGTVTVQQGAYCTYDIAQ